MMPKIDLSHSVLISEAFAILPRGWFRIEVVSSTPKADAIVQRAGLETVHC